MFIVRFTLAAGLVLLCGEATAQSPPNGSGHYSSGSGAAELIARAEKISNLDSVHVMAKLFEQAAKLVPSNDPQRVTLLMRAGSGYYFSGRRSRAREVFERAAALSEQHNNLIIRADICYTLMVLALEEGRRVDARVFSDRLTVIAASPELTDAQRAGVLRRIAVQLPGITATASR